MDILKYLIDQPNLVAIDNNELINNADIEIENNHLTFKNGNEFFVFLDNYDKFDFLTFDIKTSSDIKIFLISYQSRKIAINYQFKLKKEAKLEVFTSFMSRRNTETEINLDFSLAEKANLKLLNALTFNGNLTMNTVVKLEGISSEVNIDLLNVGGKSNSYRVKQSVYHKQKSTISNVNNWLIATDKSKLNYSVAGHIAKGNEYSKCFQSNKGIMLSDNSEIAVEPTLYIDEYNVEAGHGAAIGQMDDLQLYYLLSRGLNEEEARSLIISGYTNPFINKIGHKGISVQLTSQISRLIRGKANNG